MRVSEALERLASNGKLIKRRFAFAGTAVWWALTKMVEEIDMKKGYVCLCD